jgi:DNA-binding LacI/PurR family transcriptional regulator
MTAPTAKDVAKKAGVSIATVSRVVNKQENVAPHMRARVLQAIETLGYQPSRTAQRLRAKRGYVIGLIISDVQNPFFTAVARGIEDVAYQHGYSLILCNSDEDSEKEHLYLDVMRAEAVAGVILATTVEDNPGVRQLTDNGIPVVAIDRQLTDLGIDSVMVDSIQGTVEGLSYLIELGHQCIGFIGGPLTITTMRERRDGYVLAHRQHGLPVLPHLMRFDSPRQAGGYACALELLRQQPMMTAMFASNNLMAMGALKAIHERGLRIPEDISVISFSDMPWGSLLQPSLTVIAQPDYELGQKAAELMVERLEHPDKPVSHLQLELKLIVRASTGRPSPTGRLKERIAEASRPSLDLA